MSFKIADAYVEVDANTAKAEGSVNRFGSRFASIASTAGKAAIGLGAAVVGAAVVAGTAVGTLALKGGFERALNIQDARASLKGLGKDTGTIDEIMKNALASVKGTAFGLGDAATVAASAIAAGIQPGQDLERTLSLVADSATIAKVPLSEMGLLWNKVASTGKLNNEVIQQFGERGVPVLQWVAQQYGVTADEAFDMVSRGEVDFATFRDVMEKNLGGAAKSSGDTARGAFANVGAALGRLGAMFATPVVAGAPTLFQRIAGKLDEVGVALKPVADLFDVWVRNALSDLAVWITQLDVTKVGTFIDKMIGIGQAIAEFSPLLTIVRLLAPYFDNLLAAVAPLQEPLQNLATQVGGALADALAQVAPTIPGIADSLVAMLVATTPLIPKILELVPSLLELVPPLTDLAVKVIPPLVDLLAEVLPPAIDALSWVIENGLAPALQWVVENWTGLIDAATNLFDLLSGDSSVADFTGKVNDIGGAFGWVLSVVLPWAEGMGTAITQVSAFFAPFVNTVTSAFTTVYNAAMSVFSWWLAYVYPVIQGFGALVGAVFGFIVNTISSTLGTAQSVVGTAWANISNIVSGAVNNVRGFIENGFRALIGIVRGIFDAIMNSSIGEPLRNAINFFYSFRDTVIGFFAGAGSWLVNAGANIIGGLKAGIENALGGLRSLLGGITSMIPQVKGPPEKDKVLLRPAGRLVMGGFIKGLRDIEPELESYLGKIGPGIEANVGFTGEASTFPGMPVATTPAPTETSVQYVFEAGAFQIDMTKIKSIEDLLDMLNTLAQIARAGRGKKA